MMCVQCEKGNNSCLRENAFKFSELVCMWFVEKDTMAICVRAPLASAEVFKPVCIWFVEKDTQLFL